MTDTKAAKSPAKMIDENNDPTVPFIEQGKGAVNVMGSPPKDKNNIVYLIMLLHGVGVLMPWNMFITIAPSYYINYKLATVDADGNKVLTFYAIQFFSFLGLFSQFPNLILNALNIVLPIKGELMTRIVRSLELVCICVVFTMGMIFVESLDWIPTFFWITMISVALLNSANGIYQNSVYGLASKFPPHFTNAIILGNNMAGTFVSLINIATIYLAGEIKIAAFTYFLIAFITIACCYGSIYFLPKFAFYNYYDALSKQSIQEAADACDSTESSGFNFQIYIDVFKQSWQQMLNVFVIFFVTLVCFPAMMAEVKLYREDGVYDFIIPQKYFVAVTTFLLFNSFAAIGSFVANYYQYPGPNQLWIPVWFRVLCIPFFFFCNLHVELRTFPVLFTNEWYFILCSIFMATTSGYLSSLGMMYAPRTVDASKSHIAGMMSAFFLICGITFGIIFTFFVFYVVDNLGPIAAVGKL
uniref:Equilibrative nucleoside transporter 1 n=1 Tax=Rhabditophanes sp. KR3021 TaxID=114890 RepID=A0AC35U6D8_9BILA